MCRCVFCVSHWDYIDQEISFSPLISLLEYHKNVADSIFGGCSIGTPNQFLRSKKTNCKQCDAPINFMKNKNKTEKYFAVSNCTLRFFFFCVNSAIKRATTEKKKIQFYYSI